VAAGEEEGVASVAVLVDGTAFDGSRVASAGSVKGGHVYFAYSGDATNANTTIRGSNFTNGVFTASGGCCFEFLKAVTNAHQQIESCVFRNNTLVGSAVYGGGVAVYMRGASTEMAFAFLLCVFADNVLRGGEGGASGAGVYLQFHGGAVRSVLLSVEHSTFERNVASASGAGGDASGGGLEMLVAAEATDMATTVAHCTFRSNAARAEVEGGFADGAAVELAWQGGAAAGGLLTTIRDSTFERNRADGGVDSAGGAVFLGMLTASAYTGAVQAVISRCRFLGNAATGGGEGGDGGYGGAIYHQTLQASASLHMLGCTVRGNTASRSGAGIYAEQTNANPPRQPPDGRDAFAFHLRHPLPMRRVLHRCRQLRPRVQLQLGAGDRFVRHQQQQRRPQQQRSGKG
jgi:hypothetical protein